MNETVKRLLEGKTDNRVLPFFWQHGEDESTLREYMWIIQESGCGSVCVESRPHPDFCGPEWWRDMDVILDEARRRGMKIWILDDSHFPTGFANGAVQKASPELCRQEIFCNTVETQADAGPFRLDIRESGLTEPPQMELPYPKGLYAQGKTEHRFFDDDRLLEISALCETSGEIIDLADFVEDGVLNWEKPAGIWTICVCGASRNLGYHRDYMNMLDKESCKLLLDAVYEPHWQHYKDDFGITIAGFFSDEPELGNGVLYDMGNLLGSKQDLPWSRELEKKMEQALGGNWKEKLPLLWRQGNSDETARVRWMYMDALTRLVREDFSYQLGNWCRVHGVRYIGHVIEDQGHHCRTGSSLGHYFRGLEGQDMAGIDDIGGQVLPQGEDCPDINRHHRPRNGEFYHYGLAKLAQSAAAIEPAKGGRAMCEIFGDYGWAEGVHLEKYLADHFLVRGINYFVPHAFSPKAFPDPDCPPHFYAHGHNPQYRHFGKLVGYMNRVATLMSTGKPVAPVAILYHGEAEWADNSAMPFEKPLHYLYDAQFDCHVLPSDVFADPDAYHTELGSALRVNGQNYEVMVVPAADYITREAAQGLAALQKAGMPVLFVEKYPKGLCNSAESFPSVLAESPAVPLDELVNAVRRLGISSPLLHPPGNRVRILHVEAQNPIYLLVNEAADVYKGEVTLPSAGSCYAYNAWDNRLERVENVPCADGTKLSVTLEPLKSLIIVFGKIEKELPLPIHESGTEVPISGWSRAICEAASYPGFSGLKQIELPDELEKEEPNFSGFVRYTAKFNVERTEGLCLVISDAAEGVEVFVNGQSTGIQIAPPYRYDLSGLAAPGPNELAIEVATTLERECYPMLDSRHKMLAGEPDSKSGITGTVKLYQAIIHNKPQT